MAEKTTKDTPPEEEVQEAGLNTEVDTKLIWSDDPDTLVYKLQDHLADLAEQGFEFEVHYQIRVNSSGYPVQYALVIGVKEGNGS